MDTKVEMRQSNFKEIARGVIKEWRLYVLLLPIIIWFALFAYKPMVGLIIAFTNFNPGKGMFGSNFVGFSNLTNLLFGINRTAFWGAFRNTFMISLYGLIFGFPVPILLALLFSEINSEGYRKITQTVTYLPHFLSEVTITGIVLTLLANGAASTGILTQILINVGAISEGAKVMEMPNLFRPVYIITGLWKESGYNSIVYFAAIMGISPVMYEALKVDGGNKWQEIRYVTIPGMAPTLIIMIIMRIGRMLSVGYERVLLLQTPATYQISEVLSTLEQALGIIGNNQSLGAATGIFNSIIGFALVIGANTISRQASKTSLW